MTNDERDERIIRTETMVEDMHKGWHNGGSPATRQLKTKVDSLLITACILVTGFTGWMGWLTLLLTKTR